MGSGGESVEGGQKQVWVLTARGTGHRPCWESTYAEACCSGRLLDRHLVGLIINSKFYLKDIYIQEKILIISTTMLRFSH